MRTEVAAYARACFAGWRRNRAGDRPQQPVDKLTILFLAANPQDTQKLALDQEVRSITEAIRKSEGRDGIEF